MSVPFPESDQRQAAPPRDLVGSAREQALLREVEVLRAENLRLRKLQASPLGATTDQLEYQALFAALASAFPIGIFRTDGSGLFTHVDDALLRIFGLDAQDFLHLGWQRRVHPDDLERVRACWSQGVARARSQSIEFRLQRPDGEVVHLSMRNVPVHDAEGHFLSQLGFVQEITQLRTLEADARLKDELNRQIIASSPDCTKVLDLQGHVLQMTAQGCRLVEVDDFEQVRGSDWTSWWPEGGQALARAAIGSACQGENARFVAFGETFKGTPKWWDTTVSPIRDAQGRPVMLLAISRDITDLHQQQEAIQRFSAELEDRVRERTEELATTNAQLRRTLREAQDLYDQAPCGYYSLDAQGVVQMINQTALQWLGLQREDVVGRLSFRDLVQPEYLAQQESRRHQLAKTGLLEPEEVGIRMPNGKPFIALASSTAVYDEQGVFLRTNSTLVNITERKAAEQALQAQRNFLQTITNSVPAQLAFFDRDLICRFANASYARWLNAAPERLLGLHLSQIARPQDFASARTQLEAALRGEPQHFEGARIFPDGHRFYASIEYTPYRDEGQVQGLFIQMTDITERKATEDQVKSANLQLHETLRQAQKLYNNAPCGYHSLDASGRVVAMNDTELGWLGYTREEIVGRRNYRDFIRPERASVLDERLARLMHDDVLEDAEYEVRRRDGSFFHALLSSSAVCDANGQFLHSNTTVVDITERKTAELALRANQRFLQTVTDHVPGLIAYLDASLCFRFANAEHQRMYGMDPARIIGQPVNECVSPETWAEISPRLHAALAGQVQSFETWRQMTDGTPVYVSTKYLPDVHEGRVQGVFVQTIDITERKRIEERVRQLNDELEQRIQERSAELLESELRFRLMVDNLREYCIFFMDADGLITDWTDSAQRLEGYAPTEVLGRHYSVLFRQHDASEAIDSANQMLRLAASRGQHELHSWHERKDGSRYWSHSLLIALRDDSGELRGFAKINRDMSDAKRLDDLMRNINDELENRVAERTEQLLAANKDLESFSYSVSHDLRSPLRHISSFVSLLEEHLDGQIDETTRRYLGTIGGSARHMSQLIDGLLAFSRLGRSAVNLTAVDFTLLVDAVVSQLAHDTEGRVVDWVVAPDLPVVQGDALLLREVWANLLGNAYKYTRPRERARIEVGWSVDPVAGYTFYVRDNGVGFDTKYAQKLFGVFQRLHRASEFEGTGIGLALTRRILERHGGSIWAESQLGEGSVFYFSLPFEGASPTDFSRDTMPAALEP